MATTMNDLTGEVFGKLTVLKRSKNKSSDGSVIWKCICECGNKKEATSSRLRAKNTPLRSCGCMRGKVDYIKKKTLTIDLTGKTFGKLKVIKYIHKAEAKDAKHGWKCKCECGNITLAQTNQLQSNTKVSCGCFYTKVNGLSHTREHSSWYAAKDRCRNPNNRAYIRYGARGITFSKKWDDISVFITDMGKCPDGMSLERVNPDKGYSKNNCVWTTWRLQCVNRRKTPISKLRKVVKEEYKSGNIPKTTYLKYMKYIKGCLT